MEKQVRIAWQHPKLFPNKSTVFKQLMASTASELTAEGSTRTGKTLACLTKLFALHFKYPGLRSCIVRASNVDLDETIRFDIRNTLLRYDLDDPRSPIRAEGGATRFTRLYINEGECQLGGMNRPHHVLGTERDIVFISQLEQLTQEQYELLLTRCAGTAGNWRDTAGKPRFQILSDCNPDIPSHWMYEREKKDLMKFLHFQFEDNPLFYRDGRWSIDGKTVTEQLDKSLTGIYHDRYFKGLRVAAEGAVFQLQDCHIIDELPDLSNYHFYNAMDFGMSDPSVCLWIAWDRTANDVIVYREWRRTNTNILDMGREIKRINSENNETIENYIIDRDLHHHQLLQNESGIHSTLARKGPGSVMDGIHLIQNALAQTVLEKPGGLRIYRQLLCNTDPNPKARGQPDLRREMQALQYDPNKSDAIIPGSDDATDALRYFYLWKHSGAQAPQGTPLTVDRLNAQF